MASDKLSRKEIRSPDAFQRATVKYWSKLAEHKVPILIGAGAVLGLFLVIAIVSQVMGSKSMKAGNELARALEVSRRGVEGSLDPSADPEAPTFASHKEKNEELARQLDQVRKDFPGSEAALTATAFFGDAQFQLGNLDEAASSYEAYLADSKSGDAMRPLVLEGLGYVFEGKKDYAKALDAFDRMGKEAVGEPAKARAAFHHARVLELSGKKQEAAEAFQKVKDEFKEAPAGRDAAGRLGMLAAQGIAAPAKDGTATDAKSAEQ